MTNSKCVHGNNANCPDCASTPMSPEDHLRARIESQRQEIEGAHHDIDRLMAACTAEANEVERLRKGLEDAAYALFQLKRMTPDAAPEFARMASDRAQEVLEGYAHEPEKQA